MSDSKFDTQQDGASLPLPPLYSHEGAAVETPRDANDKQLPDFFVKVDKIKVRSEHKPPAVSLMDSRGTAYVSFGMAVKQSVCLGP